MLDIRRANAADWDGIWPILQAVVAQGDSFVYPPDLAKDEAFAIWMSPAVHTYVAVEDGVVVGSYWIRPNQPARGAHVANGAYMVSPDASGRGIGRALGEHSLEAAKAAGFLAMQFNIVVSSNERAVALWKSLGFAIVGTIPLAFQHARLGLVDTYVMHRFL